MRVVLMHNATAGQEDHSAQELIDEIRRAGHHVCAQVARRKELAEALAQRPVDLVVVAGGDGTVGKAARILAGTETPIAIVPVGTANNIARTLGIHGPIGDLAAAWRHCDEVRLDVAKALVDDEPTQFIEAFGYGAFPRVISQTLDDEDDVGCRLTRDRLLLRARLAASPPRNYQIRADGVDVSGDYFLVEILNIPSIGPRIPIAPRASPSDGKLDLVLAGEPDRALLLRGVDRILAGEEVSIALRTVQAERIEIEGEMRRHHRDGELCDEETSSLEVTVLPAAVKVLAPSSSGSRASSAAP